MAAPCRTPAEADGPMSLLPGLAVVAPFGA